MNSRSILSRADYADLLIRLAFGEDDDLLAAAIRRAYQDVRRTLRGLTKVEGHEGLLEEASRYLVQRLLDVSSGYVELNDARRFDTWHQTTCRRLLGLFEQGGYDSLRLGQVQKWLNLTFVYVYTMGPQHLPGFEQVYPWCHIPLDSAIMEQLQPFGLEPLPGAWAQLADYATYLERQQWVRDHMVFAPLDIAFYVALGREPELPE
jgi:hypothetical protein